MTRLLAAEVSTWRKRPEIVVAAIGVVVIGAAMWTSGFLSSQAAVSSLSVPEANRADAERALLASYRFPASVVSMIASNVWLFFGIYYIAAATTGGDFTWATVRTALLAGRRRVAFVTARLGFIGILGIVLLGVEVILGILLPVVLATGAGRPVRVTGVILGIATGGLSVALYGSAGVCAAVLLRDRAAPLLAGLGAVVAQTILSGLPLWSANDVLGWVPRLFPSNSLGALYLRSEQSVGIVSNAVVPSYLQIAWPIAGAITIVWIGGFVIVAILAFRRADISA